MLARSKDEFISLFKELEDPRQDEKVLYPLDEILFLLVSGVLACAESWDLLVLYGENKLELVRKYFPYTHGIPSKSTLCSVVGMLKREHFEGWFSQWAQGLSEMIPQELIAIDGKTARGSQRQNRTGVHMLNAFATKRGLVLAQKSIEEKRNEISTLPLLLEEMELTGQVVSIDAIGCQRKVANKIREKGADYFLCVKENQKDLRNDLETYFAKRSEKQGLFSYEETVEKGHGRIEIRRCWSISATEHLQKMHPQWSDLTSIALVESERTQGGRCSHEQRYYISSCAADAKMHLSYSREHWQIENKVHWVLDVVFKEDASQITRAAENMSIVRKMVFNLLQKYKEIKQSKQSIVGMRQCAAWSDTVAEDVLNVLFS
jgi:predicted transposase YbfD/YdcC